jgi:hypothetical protein
VLRLDFTRREKVVVRLDEIIKQHEKPSDFGRKRWQGRKRAPAFCAGAGNSHMPARINVSDTARASSDGSETQEVCSAEREAIKGINHE